MNFVQVTPAASQPGLIISNPPFFPDIDTQHLRAAQRLDGTITNERLREALLIALASVNDDLREWRLEQEQRGVTCIQETTSEQLDGESVNLHRYRRAVYSLTHANLLERYRNFDATAHGSKLAEQKESTADDLARDARFAVRDILGKPRSTFILI
ncbi:phage head protein [Edwardsiella ictaluri]|uniref:Phage head completion protein (GPL) n=1 Tax=Edwardsiella ictaluri (strain 93-146) TaxID=634503 RepID=C5BEN1_EDWI9|nr:head completion/stabilization protein [Edwardsiella ictaluri]ACR70272.1 phage head completion protein (GPL) [Edwardsiella ictaluri 93-146]AVZ82861.1 phage head protein [Edwardsiella ictaluri]EKS7762471.1 head completion/stabilization protein [Edwardsiella ictaluri]EKS7770421.1 head completion/stabilization protein [Edwardsiella ictaluri]EKS7773563.1 head completion/stabilization protein [Edwardsiella ictaluri]